MVSSHIRNSSILNPELAATRIHSCYWLTHLMLVFFLYLLKTLENFQKQPPEVFYKKGVLKNFSKFTGKHLCQSLFFNKVSKVKRDWRRCFPLNFEKFLRTPPGDCFWKFSDVFNFWFSDILVKYRKRPVVWNGFIKPNIVWKVSKYGVFSGPYFPAFGLNTERYGVSLRIQSECGKIRTRKNYVFGHFSRSVSLNIYSLWSYYTSSGQIFYKLITIHTTDLLTWSHEISSF